MIQQYKVELGRTANGSPRVVKYWEDGKEISPPIIRDEIGSKFVDGQMAVLASVGLEKLTAEATLSK